MNLFLGYIAFVLVSLALVKGVWGRPAADQDVDSTESNEDGMEFFFRQEKRSAEEEVEISTEGTEDQAGFFFKHKQGKRSADVEESTESLEDEAAFFFRPRSRFGKRSSGEEDSTVSSEDGAAFFFRPRFGRRSAGTLEKIRRLAADIHEGHKERRSADSGTGFFFSP